MAPIGAINTWNVNLGFIFSGAAYVSDARTVAAVFLGGIGASQPAIRPIAKTVA